MIDAREPFSSREIVLLVHGMSGRLGSLGTRIYGRHIVSSSNLSDETVQVSDSELSPLLEADDIHFHR